MGRVLGRRGSRRSRRAQSLDAGGSERRRRRLLLRTVVVLVVSQVCSKQSSSATHTRSRSARVGSQSKSQSQAIIRPAHRRQALLGHEGGALLEGLRIWREGEENV